MITKDSERLIEQYLTGEMTTGQEEEFFINVAVDADLRRMLKSYQVVDSAIRKYRDVTPADHSASRTQLLASLGLGETRQAPSQTPRSSYNRWLVGGLSIIGTILLLLVFPIANSDAPMPGAAVDGPYPAERTLLPPDAPTVEAPASDAEPGPAATSAERPSQSTPRSVAAPRTRTSSSTAVDRENPTRTEPRTPVEPKPDQHAQKRIDNDNASTNSTNDASSKRKVDPSINAPVDVDMHINQGRDARKSEDNDND